jgi:hypothetical protein
MMDLPPALEELFWHEIQRYEEETNMPYITSVERQAMERGRGEGLRWAIEATWTERWGAEGAALAGGLATMVDQAQLEGLMKAISKANRLEEVRQA